MHEAQTTGLADRLLQPWLKFIPHPAMQVWKQLDPSQYDPQHERWLNAWHARNDTLSRVVSLLHEEGAPLLVGTDTSVRFVIQGLSVHQELANFVRAGLHPFEALSCATREAARFLDQSGEWGTVTAGKRADLLLVRANPLEDVAALRDLEVVFVNGFYLQRAELDALLDQQEQLALPHTFESLSTVQLHSIEGKESSGECAEWLEYANDTLCGRLSYRHQALPTGEWRIEELYIFEQGSIFYLGGSQHHRTSVWLNPDFTLRQATYVYESFAGTEQGKIMWTPEEGYVIHRTEIDGYEIHTTIKTPPVVPGDILVHTVLPLYLNGKQDSITASMFPLLSMDGSAIRIQEMTLTAAHLDASAKEDTEQRWHLHLQQAQGSREYIYQFDENGVFLSMREGQRKLVACKDTERASSKKSISKQ
jgi:Amidohydrolase family